MVTSLLWEYAIEKMAIMEDRLLLDILERYHYCRDMFSGQVDSAYDIKFKYNTHNKKLLAIFKAFRIQYYYFESLAFVINIVMDYKKP